MIRLLTKVGLSGSDIAGTLTFGSPLLIKATEKEEDKEVTESKVITNIETLADISIYEKQKGCSFAFISSWDDKKVYNAEEFVRKETEKVNLKETDWVQKTTSVANEQKDKCQKGKTIAFGYNGNRFFIKT